MEAARDARNEEKSRLLNRLAELLVEEQHEQGVFDAVPHYSVLERASRALGQELGRTAQQRVAAEVAATSEAAAPCPTCGQRCPVEMQKRTVSSIDGPVELIEPRADCPACRRAFFPSA
jgi:hypothetical protein